MKIIIKSSDERTIRLWIPSFLLSSQLIQKIIYKNISDLKINYEQMKVIIHGLKQASKNFPKLDLIHVVGHDGDCVKITL